MRALMRSAGVLLPLTALPSRHGVGNMGEGARRFVDLLAQNGVRYWQILPINPLGFGNSPYQPFSSSAGDPLLISLSGLEGMGLLGRVPPFQPRGERVAYDAARAHKDGWLRKAFAAFAPDGAYDAFAELRWVRPYAIFRTFRRANGDACWVDWPAAQKNWPQARAADLAPFDEDIRYEMFLQYIFFTQWMALKTYANERGVEIIGDIPIYVGIDSVDVWWERENFLLDADGQPTVVAGVPPDYFSATGQRWGNPLYDWPHMEKDGFRFWINRFQENAVLFDVIRIDHFRGFDTYWEIPADCPTAEMGAWKEAPGYAMFDAVLAALPHLAIIAEDLGMMRPEVFALRDHYGFRGMRILQFDFDPAKPLNPSKEPTHSVLYTGTHDNQTTRGWFEEHDAGWQARALERLAQAGYRGNATDRFVRLALDDAADIAIIPAMDILRLDDGARLNTPGTVGSPNWEWKLKRMLPLAWRMRAFGRKVHKSGRRERKTPQDS